MINLYLWRMPTSLNRGWNLASHFLSLLCDRPFSKQGCLCFKWETRTSLLATKLPVALIMEEGNLLLRQWMANYIIPFCWVSQHTDWCLEGISICGCFKCTHTSLWCSQTFDWTLLTILILLIGLCSFLLMCSKSYRADQWLYHGM